MRIVKEINNKACKITVFSWNGKYLIKLEQGAFEQTYKVSELDVLESEIDELLNEAFIEKALVIFETMGGSLRKSLQTI